jgi:hypothetical protein
VNFGMCSQLNGLLCSQILLLNDNELELFTMTKFVHYTISIKRKMGINFGVI